MSLFHIPLESLSESNLQTLQDGAVPEGRSIEYKRELPGSRDEDKKEFLADVSSFANAAGGDLFYGIEETGGIPTAIPGIQTADADAEIRRLDSIVRSSIDPRLPGVHLRAIPLSNGAYVLVIRVPQSWASPHMVVFKNSSRFFSRTSAGKYQLDVRELRAIFARSGDAATRIRQFRDERLARIIAGEAAFELSGRAFLVLHLVPFTVIDPGTQIDLNAMRDLRPMYTFGWDKRYNLDGFVSFRSQHGKVESYVQGFRNGAIESVNASLLTPLPKSEPLIPGKLLVHELLEYCGEYLKIQRSCGTSLPVAVIATLIGVKGFRMDMSPFSRFARGDEVDRDLVQLPEVIIDDWDVQLRSALLPIVDALWNAAGFSSSPDLEQFLRE